MGISLTWWTESSLSMSMSTIVHTTGMCTSHAYNCLHNMYVYVTCLQLLTQLVCVCHMSTKHMVPKCSCFSHFCIATSWKRLKDKQKAYLKGPLISPFETMHYLFYPLQIAHSYELRTTHMPSVTDYTQLWVKNYTYVISYRLHTVMS